MARTGGPSCNFFPSSEKMVLDSLRSLLSLSLVISATANLLPLTVTLNAAEGATARGSKSGLSTSDASHTRSHATTPLSQLSKMKAAEEMLVGC
eukprot:6188382-Pleurochrysis_carterae.AAC.2